MSDPSIIPIIEKYATGALSVEEEAILNDWLAGVSAKEFHLTLDQSEILPAQLKQVPAMSPEFANRLEMMLDHADDQDRTIRMAPWKKWTAAAAVIGILCGGAWLWMAHKDQQETVPPATAIVSDLTPATTGAILTLADGKQIVLDSAGNGSLVTEGHTNITKGNNGTLVYGAAKGDHAPLMFNTLTTPRGRKINVVLADGTKVWLNAASSIRYPTSFGSKERTVEITGEAYFEVAKDQDLPFIVKKTGSNYGIQVLGTSFNVNAYDDENVIRTTLLTGSIKIIKGNKSEVLQPGQQAVVGNGPQAAAGGDDIAIVPAADLDEVMAWKNGIFKFDRADIATVMRQVARWYDVDVEYKGTIAQHFGGTISRNVNVSQVFQMLELTGAVRFTMDGRKIEVEP